MTESIIKPWKGTHRYGRLHHGIVIARYELHGRDWLRRITAEDRKVIADLGRSQTPDEFHSLGGKARVQKALRDKRGRFIKKEDSDASGSA